MASASISCNSSTIKLDTSYTISYSCTSTPYNIYCYMHLETDYFLIWKYENITATSGSKTFTLSTADYETTLTNNGYSPSSYQATKFEFYISDALFEAEDTYFCTFELESYSDCSAPSEITLGNTIAENMVTLAWRGASGGISNDIVGYDVQYSDSSNGSSWGTWTNYDSVTTSNTWASLGVYPPDTRGYYRRFRVRTRGSAGLTYYSNYKSCADHLRKNQLPVTPSVIPSDGKTTYNSRPRILVTSGVDPDGQTVSLVVTNFNGNEDTENISRSDVGDADGAVYMHPEQVAAGSFTAYVHATDSFNVASSVKSIGVTVANLAFDEIVVNETPVKAQHITELQTAINTVRDYYGLNAYAFTVIVAGESKLADWTSHVSELRTAINEIITFVNGFDSTNTVNNIAAVEWLSIPENKPRKDVIEQIRNTIPLL